MKVLIIDDDVGIQSGLTRLLRASWHPQPPMPLDIVCVGTLAAGKREADSANVTILDLGLPDVEDIIDAINAIPFFRPPVIVLTGHDDPGVTAACKKRGAAHVFTKGTTLSLLPAIFDAMADDIVRRANER